MSTIELVSMSSNGQQSPVGSGSTKVRQRNAIPVAADDTLNVREVGAARGQVITGEDGVDQDADGDLLKFVAVDGAANKVGTRVGGSEGGLFTIQANGVARFDTNDDFNALGQGETAISKVVYTVSDGQGGTATVQAMIEDHNDAPVAKDDGGFAVVVERWILIDPGSLLVNDLDPTEPICSS